MSSYSLVESTLQRILNLIKPNNDDWAVRFHIIQDVRDAVETVESLRGATVEPFGSFVSNVFTKWGGLDISIEILRGSHITNAGRKQKETVLADVFETLRSKGTWRKLRFVSNARVPFLRLEHNLQSISCDISINNLIGQMKAKLLFWINEIDRRFHKIVLLVKEWAIAHDINEAESGSLHSYCLTLLVIFHFQTCVPAILPPLKELYPRDLAHDLSGTSFDVSELMLRKHIEETFAVFMNRFRRSRQRNRSSISDLLISFFAKFSDIDERALEQGINPYSGQWEDIGSNTAWLPRTFALYVEDPFEQPANTARAVTGIHLTRMAEAFRATHNILASNGHNQATLFATLIRQDRLPPLTRSQVRNPYKPGSSNWSRPQVDKAISAPSQSHQTPNTRNTGRSDNANKKGPVRPNHNLAQQIWRPKHHI
ncbi:TUTase domain-containing protein [Heracleum sosnowskyi]|uniref:TUTase domain-containing protein n=1 Tax=Heracleum sosnowskyi TaxID=360622 RepID=A0AAD8MRD1_9APIA|nr:TUTase domain-containing protein [Heracleum sosnowskyi]